MVPLLALGVPSSPTIAVLMGAFIVNGITPGPFLFTERPELVWTVIASFFVGNAILLILNLPLVGLWAKLLKIPFSYMCAGVLIFCVIGAYGLKQSLFDVWIMLGFGVLGYLLRKLDLPLAPAILALILGPMMERSLRTTLEISAGSFAIFLDRPLALALLAVPVIVLGFMLLKPRCFRPGPASRRRMKVKQEGTMYESPYPDRRHRRRRPGRPRRPPSLAQNFPRKAIQMIVAFPAGGSTDIGARIVAASAEKDFGQPVMVVNKAGAGGQLGFTEAAARGPDGYTLSFLNLPGINTIILDPERKAVFSIDSFIPVINQVLDPGLIWVKADSPYKTLADLIEAAKKNPGKISACTTGILSDDHLAILMMQEAAKVRVPHRPFRRRRAADHRRAGRPCRRGLRQCRRRLQARALGRVPRAGRHSTTSAPSSCPTCRPPRSSAIRPSSPPRRAASACPRARRPTSSRSLETGFLKAMQKPRHEGEDGRRRPGA